MALSRFRLSFRLCGPVFDQLLIEELTELNFSEAERPRRVTAAMQTTAMRATRSAYSTRLAPRSDLAWARIQAATKS